MFQLLLLPETDTLLSMKRYVFLISVPILLFACKNDAPMVNPQKLSDANPAVMYVGSKGVNTFLFKDQFTLPVQRYQIVSSGEPALYDPVSWVLKGSFDGETWVVLDEQKDQKFCFRYQEKNYSIKIPSNYKQYLLDMCTASHDTLKLGKVFFFEDNCLSEWTDFNYPEVYFELQNPDSEGARLFRQLVQDPDEYIKYHCRKVAEILYFSAHDPMPEVTTIHYKPESHDETCGMLYRELVHAYQLEPKGIGTYSTNKEFRACVEGLADAVRAEAGFFDVRTQCKPGGHWLDGYKTTGFFLQWLTTKDPDAIRKFNQTAGKLDVWSFDKAMKAIFGNHQNIEKLWNEYQSFLMEELNEKT